MSAAVSREVELGLPSGFMNSLGKAEVKVVQIAPVAVALLLGLLLLGYSLRAPIIVALFASLAFGSTAIAIMPSIGGASPLLFAPLAGLLIASVLMRPNFPGDLAKIFSLHWTPTVTAFLLIYVVAGAMIMPHLFAGQTSAFIHQDGRVVEVSLSAVTGNVTQSFYFTAGVLSFFALSILLMHDGVFCYVRRGFFAFATIHAFLCIVDLGGKLAGAGDILSPIRTAGYTMLTEVQTAGFWRIVGGYPEASSSAAATLTAFAFMFSYWRATGSTPAFVLGSILLLLLLFSTSTTGYVVLALLSLTFLVTLLSSARRDRLMTRDLLAVAIGVLALTTILAVFLYNEQALDPYIRLIQTTIIDKSLSASAAERSYWNYTSLLSFVDTGGLGIGLGSSRASSWFVAVISQLGVIGAILLGILLFELLKRPSRRHVEPPDAEIVRTSMGMRAAAFASLLAMLVSGGHADPGIFFFLALATVFAARAHLAGPERKGRPISKRWPLEESNVPSH